MNPSRPFIQRPVATALFMAAIVLAGLVGFRLLPLSALPQVDYPTIQVQTLYPGASPEVMSQTVTAPLERQLGEMSGLARMSSVSTAGASVVTLQFNLGETLDVAEQEVQAAINASGSLLPADLPAPPVYAKVNPADAPVLTLAITSDTLPLTEVQNLVNTRLAQKISQVSGVGLVSLSGGQRPAMRIQADTQALASYGLTLSDVQSAISASNANSAKGSFDGPTRSYTINANDQLLSVDDYKNLIITYKDGAPIRLSNVAQVVESAENTRLGAWADKTPAIIVNVQRQPGANVIQTVDAIKAKLPELQAGLPATLDVRVLADRTTGIRASVEHVEVELLLAVALVVLVIFFFLHSLRATVIASLAVPISLIGSCGVMYLMGFSLNNLSLMALTIATGFVVDDAIVMIENITRHLEKGEKPMEAALKGAKEIGFTIISLTISLIAVLIPLLFMGDVVGRLFREFAISLAITILISAVVSLTLTPMLSARWLKPHEGENAKGVGKKAQDLFEKVEGRYEVALAWVLERQVATLVVAVGTLVLTGLLYMIIPKGLFPTQDTGQLQARTEMAQSVSYDRMADLQQQAAEAILDDPAVENVASFIGVDGANNAMLHTGQLQINLKHDRSGSQEKIMQRLRERVAQVPGVTLHLQPTQDLTIDAETGPTQYRLSLEGADTATIKEWAGKLTAELAKVKAVRNVYSDASATGQAAYVDIDRDTAARLSITASDVDDALYSAFGQRIVSTIFTETNQYRVILEAKPGVLTDPTTLGNLNLKTGGGSPTPLAAFSTIKTQQSPLQVTHVSQFPATTIGFDTAPGVSLGHAVDEIRKAMTRIEMPTAVTHTFLGAAGAYQNSLSNQLWLILAAVVCVYIVLGVLYESYIHPLTILSTLPSAGVGALLALWITGNDLGVIGIIGIILLIGIVKKNAIMMIDFAIDAEREEGKSPRDAIFQAAILRFRPILMTTLAALFAAVPLMLGFGEGAELRRPLGIAIFGGLLLSQLLTMFTTPVVYLAFDRLAPTTKRERREETPHPDRIDPEPIPGGAVVNLSGPFIRRPVATILLTIGVAMAGIAAFFVLPVSPLPQVDFPTISVSSSLSGASPQTMASSVATPLERRLGVISGVNEMTSQSSTGRAQVTLQFDLNRNIDGAAREVQAAINAARADLPSTLRSNPTYRKANPSDAPVIILALTSDTKTPGQIYDAVSNVVAQRLAQVTGVGDVEIGGGSLPAVRISANPFLLNKYGVAMEDIRAAIQSANANRPKGALEGNGQRYQIYTTGAGRKAADYAGLQVAWRDGAGIKLSDVAAVTDSVADTRTLGLFNGKPSIIVLITAQPGANIIQTVDSVRATLPELRAQLPGDINVAVASDRTNSIRASLHEIEVTLLISIILVIVVVSAFLRSARATFIPAAATIVSLLGTFGVMYLLGFSLNNLSLMAITVATGFVVDDAIVVLENTARHMEKGMDRFAAALLGAREVGFTVLSISISLVAVFIPLLFMGGQVGRLFREFAVTLSAAVLISLVISLTTTPMMCAYLLRPHRKPEEEGPIARLFERAFNRIHKTYEHSLDWALAAKPLVILILISVIAMTAWLYIAVPKGFFPQQDSGQLNAGIRADQSVSSQAMQKKLRQVVNIIRKDKAVDTVVGFTGGGRAGGGFLFVNLKPIGERKEKGSEVIARLKPQLQRVTGLSVFLNPVQDLRMGGRQSNSTYQYTLTSDSSAALKEWAGKLAEAMKAHDDVMTDVDSDQQENGVETLVTVDRDSAARLGVTPRAVDNALYNAFGQRQVATIYEDVNQYAVILEWQQAFAQGPEALNDVYVPTRPSGTAKASGPSVNPALRDQSTGSALNTAATAMTPLPAIASVSQNATPTSVNHQNGELATTVSFNLADGKSLSDAKVAIAQAEAEIGMPTTVRGSFQGSARAATDQMKQQPLLILAAIVAIYIVLGILYESYVHPITVLSTLPAAGVGAVLALLIFKMEFSIIALIGVFLLLGIVKKNAILIIDFALDAQRSRGLTAQEAVREASLLRFRPILMTTLAAALGALPLAIGFGEGAELRRPLGVAIIGGLIASQLLTLITTPVVYVYLDRLRGKTRKDERHLTHHPTAPEPA